MKPLPPTLAFLLFAAAATAAPVPAARLYWRNGEPLAGEVVAADATTLTWKTPVVAEPVVLDRARLQFVDFEHPSKSEAANASWSVLLRNGDCVHATMVRIKDAVVEMDCPHHGHLLVPIKEVRSLRRLKGSDLVYAGPVGRVGWSEAGVITEGGGMGSRKWNQTLTMPMHLPGRVAMDLSLSSTALINFKLVLTSRSHVSASIETWGSDVVMAAPPGAETYGAFVPLLKLKGGEKGLALRVCWDQPARLMRAFDLSGKELGSLTWTMRKGTEDGVASDKSGSAPGLSIKNRGANWVVDDLFVRGWVEGAPGAVTSELPRVRMLEGSWRQGGDVGSLDLASVQEVVWSEEAPPLNQDTPRPAAIFYDGTMVGGRLVGMNGEALAVRAPWSDEPVRCDTAGLMRIVFETPAHPVDEPPMNKLDRLRAGPVTVHGTIVCNGGKEPLWLFVGAKNPVPVIVPEKRQDLEMVWARPVDEARPQGRSALFFLDDGAVLRAAFQSVDETGVTFDSPWTTGRSVPHEHMRAVRLVAPAGTGKGFRDSSWRTVKGTDRQVHVDLGDKPEKDVLHLSELGKFGHPGLATGNEIRFTLKPSDGNYGGLQIGLFTDDEGNASQGMTINLLISRKQLYAIAGDTNRGVSNDSMLRNIASTTANVKILFRDSKVQVLVNDTPLVSEPVKPSKMAGTGFTLSSGTMWGGSPRPVEVSNFLVVEGVGELPGLHATEEAKHEAVVLPRFRRENPPAHLLVATNGDVVRGQMEAATAKRVRFTTGLETHDFSTDLVQAMVWLARPKTQEGDKKAAPTPSSPSIATHWLVLDEQSSLGLQVESFMADKVVGRSELLGKVELPLDRLAMLRWAPAGASPALKSYLDWQLEYAPEPVLPEAEDKSSALLGKAAPDFVVPVIGGGEFKLSKLKGRVVVMDFWATWCGPCVGSMPGFIGAMNSFKDKPVTFMTLNQDEPAEQVKRFAERRSWQDLPIALDANVTVAGKYGVEGIPFTVLVGKDGTVQWVHTGYSADGEAKLKEAVNAALSKP